MKIITPQEDINLKPKSRILFMLFPWFAKGYKGKGLWWSLREYLLHYRSNPRSVDYMLDLAHQFSNNYLKKTMFVDLLFSPEFKDSVNKEQAPYFNEIFTTFDEIKNKQYDAIVLLFSDAIGFGWEEMESKLSSLQSDSIFVINGRRRIFKLDKESRRALRLRRSIARAWWLESIFGVFIIAASAVFWLHDLLFGYPEAS